MICVDDSGVADGFDVGPVDGVVIEPQHAPRGIVDVLHAPVVVDDQHAFDHAREDGDHAGAIARQLVDAPAQLVHGPVHRPRHLAELVVAIVGRRPAQIADAVASGDRQDVGDAPLERRGQDRDTRKPATMAPPSPRAVTVRSCGAAFWRRADRRSSS